MSVNIVFFALGTAQAADTDLLTRTSPGAVYTLTAAPGDDGMSALVTRTGPDGVFLFGLRQPDLPEHLLLLDSGELITVDGPAIALYDADGACRWSRLIDEPAASFSWRHEAGALLIAAAGEHADSWIKVRISDGHTTTHQQRYRKGSIGPLLLEADLAAPARAAELARRALAIDTQHVGAWLRLIEALQLTGRHSPALHSADIAFQIPAPDSDDPGWHAYRNLYVLKAHSARLLQGTVDADAILLDGLEHSPDDAVLRDALAAGMIGSNRLDEARALFPLDQGAEAVAEAGDFFAAQGQLGVAEEYYRRLAEVAADPVLMGRLAALYLDRQDYEAAVTVRTEQLRRWDGAEDTVDWHAAVLQEIAALEDARGRLTAQAN